MSIHCGFAYYHLNLTYEGFGYCCRSRVIPYPEFSEMNLFQMPILAQGRESLKSGLWPNECSACEGAEARSHASLRTRFGELFFLKSEQPPEPFRLRAVEILLSSKCALECVMCNVRSSSSWTRTWSQLKRQKDYFSDRAWSELAANDQRTLRSAGDNPIFWEIFENLHSELDLVNLSGGEPLLDAHHDRIVTLLSQSARASLMYFSSLQVAKQRLQDLIPKWRKLPKVIFNISIEETRAQYSSFRRNGCYQTLKENFQLLAELPNVELQFALLMQAGNILRIPKIIEELMQDFGVEIVPRSLQNPTFLSSAALPLTERNLAVSALEQSLRKGLFTKNQAKALQSEIAFMRANDFSHLNHDHILYTKILGDINAID